MAEEYADIPLEHMPTGESFPSTAPSIDWLDYYLGSTGIPDRLRSANELLNPIEGLRDAGASAASGDYLGAATDTAAALVPVGGALAARAVPAAARGLGSLVSRGSDDAADALTEATTGMTRRDFLRNSAAAGGVAALGPEMSRALAPDTARVAARSVAQVAPTVGPAISHLYQRGLEHRSLFAEEQELLRARGEIIESFGGPSDYGPLLKDRPFEYDALRGDPRLAAINEQIRDFRRRKNSAWDPQGSAAASLAEVSDQLVSRLREDPSLFADELDALYEAQVSGEIPLYLDDLELMQLGELIFDNLAGGKDYDAYDILDPLGPAEELGYLEDLLDEPWQIEALHKYRDYVDKVIDVQAARREE